MITLPTDLRDIALRPGDDGFADAREIFNSRTSENTPSVILGARDASDVLAVARHAGETSTPLAVRAGGHGVDGTAMPDGALVADLSGLTSIDVDPSTGVVRLGAGVLLRDMDAALIAHGLVVPSGTVSTTGIAGLTLGGGIGYLMRRYGATVDNLLSCSVVTLDGRLVTASERENPDLFWALRGGGGNFGVVTEFEFRARPLAREVAAGFLLFPLDQAPEVLAGLREYLPRAPRELAVVAALTQCPPLPPVPPEFHGRPVLMPIVVHSGDPSSVPSVLDALAGLGRPVASAVAPMPWTEANRMLDVIAPPGRRYYSKGGYLTELDDATIDVVVRNTASAPAPSTPPLPSTVQNLWAMGGAVSDDVAEDAMAFSREGASWLWESVTEWDDARDDATYRGWLDGLRGELTPHLRSNSYVNLSTDHGPTWRRGVWGSPEKYQRLVTAKTTWDPHNLLRYNKNIKPR
ncbi:FAD-binding oxidoreductase [Pseudonocardia spinosispora]|uniref:FAD-binding oxidoreductase n=1 Tax=Pseudonocardia spinosispora TaxID=103441 RepID=UPI000419EC57|nr:FAD-dependent oxidoreductase [Pseudonocardia spinosispora]